MNNDLERAKALLREMPACTCAFVRGEQERTSEERGICPLIALLDAGETLRGYAAADRIVGRAAALLYVRLGLDTLFAEVLSAKAEAVLKAGNILYEYATLAEGIVNRRGDGLCPMEEATEHISDPCEAERVLRAKLASLRQEKSMRCL